MNEKTPTDRPISADAISSFDPFDIVGSNLAVQQAWLLQPERLCTIAQNLALDISRAHDRFARVSFGVPSEPAVAAVPYDERFQDPVWINQPGFAYVKDMYLLYGRWLEDAIYTTSDVDPARRRRAAFWTKQWLDAIAPTNFFWTNPEALRRCIATYGLSLLWGLQNWLRDVAAGDVRMVEPDVFEVGRDLATAPGQVVLRNDLLELIQYLPTTEQVHAVPIVLVAPWINKYYIMDLSPHNSLVRYLIDQGFTVFATSWKNPGSEARATTPEDYLLRGVRPALEIARAICGVPHVHAAGYCLGGTALALLLAWLNADPADRATNPVAHWTAFAALVDFGDPGEIGVFLNETSFEFLRERMAATGYMDGATLANAFRLLRPNSLIWHYAVHSYLYGEELPSSDVLFWNCDTTRMPAAMHEFYLRELYLNNRLAQAGELEIGGRRLDLGAIAQSLYAVGAEQDHIAPWRQTFRLCGLTGGPARYALATSGHILGGIINPPADPPKRRYWSGDATGQRDPDNWLEQTAKVSGSWWEDWTRWLSERCGPLGPPPSLGNAEYPPLQAAPGSYVLER